MSSLHQRRSFGILPAGGESRRMGQPKLRLLWQGKPLLVHAINAMQHGGATHLCVVLHPSLQDLVPLCEAEGAIPLVLSQPTPDMKQSVIHGLDHLQQHFQPTSDDVWLLTPADLPLLSPRIIGHLLQQAFATNLSQENPPRVWIPTLGGKRGHPILLPWSLAAAVKSLGSDEGINALLQTNPVQLLACDALEPYGERAFDDIDTPEEYARWLAHP